MRTINNPNRGCGNLRAGGFYLQGSMGAGGTLEPWTWLLGEGVTGGFNYHVDLPAREVGLIRLPESLDVGRCVMPSDPEQLGEWTFPSLQRLPQLALIDHVGSKYYTPWSFAEECRMFGPSRRIPEALLKQIVLRLPLPIVFAHDWMPLVAPFATDAVRARTNGYDVNPHLDPHSAEYRLKMMPSPAHPRWGIRLIDNKPPYNGEDHWLVAILRWMDDMTAGKPKKKIDGYMGMQTENALRTTEQMFGISWMTRGVYVTTGNETDERLGEIADSGIEPVQAGDIEIEAEAEGIE